MSRRQRIALAGVLAVLAALPFLPVLDNEFTNWDDRDLIVENALIRDLSWNGIVRIFTSMHAHLYNPLVVLSHALEYRFFGLDPRVYHGVNLALHLVSTVLLFVLLNRWGFPPAAAVVGALLWAVHPLRVESVAWASERKDVLCGVFFLAGLLARERAAASAHHLRWVPVFAWFLAALLSKPAAVTFPAALWAVDWFRRRPWKPGTILTMLPFFAVSSAVALLTIVAQHRIENIRFGGSPPALAAAGNAVYALFFYAYKTILPIGLSVHYPRPDSIATAIGSVAPGIAVVAVAIVAFLCADRELRRVVLFGVLFSLLTIAPMVQAVPVGDAAAADRYTYLPAMGLAVITVEIARRALLWRSAVASVAAVLLVFGSGALTWQRSALWKDSLSIWTDAVERYPRAPLALVCRGRTFSELGDHQRALEDLDQAVALAPDYTMARLARGIVLDRLGRHREAVEDFTAVIARRPSYANAWYNRGIAHQNLHDSAAAVADYTRALALNPALAQAAVNRGNIRVQAGDLAGARRDYTAAIRAKPDLAEAYNNRAFVRYLEGDTAGALYDIRRARALGWQVNPAFVQEVARRVGTPMTVPRTR